MRRKTLAARVARAGLWNAAVRPRDRRGTADRRPPWRPGPRSPVPAAGARPAGELVPARLLRPARPRPVGGRCAAGGGDACIGTGGHRGDPAPVRPWADGGSRPLVGRVPGEWPPSRVARTRRPHAGPARRGRLHPGRGRGPRRRVDPGRAADGAAGHFSYLERPEAVRRSVEALFARGW